MTREEMNRKNGRIKARLNKGRTENRKQRNEGEERKERKENTANPLLIKKKD